MNLYENRTNTSNITRQKNQAESLKIQLGSISKTKLDNSTDVFRSTFGGTSVYKVDSVDIKIELNN